MPSAADVDRDAGVETAAGERTDRTDRTEESLGPRLERGVLGATVSGERKVSRLEKRRARIREEIERNRRGDHKIPTWVLAVALVVFIAGWVALIVFA